MIEIKDNNVDELINSNEYVLIDFYAPWCGPCKVVSKTLDEVTENEVVIAKCNVDENTELAERFKVRNIPTILFIKNGKIVDKAIGNIQKANLDVKINNLILTVN